MITKKLTAVLALVLGITLSVQGWPWSKDGISKIRMTWSQSPATSAKIIWDAEASKGKAQKLYFDVVDHGTSYRDYANHVSLTSFVKYKGMFNATVHLKNLNPETKYYFVIRSSKGKLSKRYWFETLSDSSSTRLSIISGGDSRNNRTPRVKANKIVAKIRPHFVMFGGDMTGIGSKKQWKRWFDDWQNTIAKDGRITPIVAARGNHERDNEMLSKLFGTNSSVHYALSFGGNLLRVYTLNSESSVAGGQFTWLQEDLERNKNHIWKLAQYHKPMRPHVKKKSENNRIYQTWGQAFFKYGVDLVSESDSHTVKTTFPIRPSTDKDHDEGFVRDSEFGTVYVGEGCWGAPLRGNDDDKSWTKASGSFNQVKWIKLDNRGLSLSTIKVNESDDAESLTDDNRFDLPEGLTLWTDGDVELSPREYGRK